VVLPLIAFSVFPTKRANYALPALPAIALAAGWWWDRAVAGIAPAGGVLPRILALGTAGFGTALLAAGPLVRDVPREISSLGWLFGPGFLLGGLAAWRAASDRPDLASPACLLPPLYLGLSSLRPSASRPGRRSHGADPDRRYRPPTADRQLPRVAAGDAFYLTSR
jgi:hypothetical protein